MTPPAARPPAAPLPPSQLLDAFPPDLAPHTLVVTNLREPLSRAVSHFHMLRRHNHSLALEGSIRRLFLEHPRGMARTRNKQVGGTGAM